MQVPAQPAYRQVSPDSTEEDDSDPNVIFEDSPDNLESDSEQDWTTLCGDDHDAQIRPPTMEEPNPPTLCEVMLTVVDWYASHKQTYTATTDLYDILKLVAPPGHDRGHLQSASWCAGQASLDLHRAWSYS